MTMLNGTLSLHDVDDVEAAAQKIINDFSARSRAYFRDHDREDLLAFLISIAWRLSVRYDPNRGWSYSKLFYQVGSRRIADWYRARYADTRSAKPALPLSLDAPASTDTATTDGPGPSLVDTLAAQEGPGDLAADLDSDSLVGWLRANRDRSRTPADPWLGRPTDHRTTAAHRAA
jgi:hypothetical protein